MDKNSDFISRAASIYDKENSTETCLYYEEIGYYRHPLRVPQDTLYLSFPSYSKVMVSCIPEDPELDPEPLPKDAAPFTISIMERKEKRDKVTGELQFLYSPMSMDCYYKAIFPDSSESASVISSRVEYLALEYKDGSTYIIEEKREDQFLDNTNLAISDGMGEEGYSIYAFNRLVDWDNVRAVHVNERIIYME